MCDIDAALKIAVNAHCGQKDKGAKPYILHPLKLCLSFEAENLQIIAVLHDVIEDTDLSLDDLKKHGFSSEVLDALDALTKRQSERYEDFIDRVSKNPLATAVKREDLLHNLDLTRLDDITDADLARIRRYVRALKVLPAPLQAYPPA